MHLLIAILLCLLLGVAVALAQSPQPREPWRVDAASGVEFNFQTGDFSATNGVVIQYGTSKLAAHRVSGNQNTGDVKAEGDVRLETEGRTWQGDKLEYNFKTGHLAGESFRFGQPPFFTRGAVLVGDRTNNVYVLADGYVTTDDYSEPGSRVRARSIVIVPDEYVEAKDAVLYAGKVPIFYFPHYKRSLKRHPNFWMVVPGYRGQFGPYLLTSYNWFWNERLDGAVHFDGYLNRGVGVGPDFNYHLPKFGEGTFKYYFIRDNDPHESDIDLPVNEHRQRVWFTHQGVLRTNLTLKTAVRYQNDALVVRDFFESEYRENPQPITFLEANQSWPNFSLNALAVGRVNDYVETVERLPDLKLSGLPQQIGRTPFYYESDSSVGWYRHKFAYDQTNAFSAWRADTYHQVTLPRNFFGWLNVAPRVGGRFTHYSEADVSGTILDDQDRGVFNTGAEASFKASRVWPGLRNRFFQMDGLRHILEPSVNYVWVPEPNRVPSELPQFDYESPSTRLLPITYPEYNSIDSIDSQNVLRLGLRNKLQTKRAGVVDNFLHWAIYTDWRLKPRAGQYTFSDLYSDLDFRPFSWLMLNSELRYGINEKRWNEANHTLTLLPNTVWNVSFGHRYLRQLPQYGPDYGNDLFYTTIYYRLNENWGARASIYYEANYGVIEEQQYTLYRDFRSWVGALTLRWRENPVGGQTDFTIGFTFSTKAFPRYDLTQERLYPSRLLGY